jgi:hypothetical protein
MRVQFWFGEQTCQGRHLLGLVLSRGGSWNQRHVHKHHVLLPDNELELAESLCERHAFDVADSTAKLNHANIWGLSAALGRFLGNLRYPSLNLVGDVRHHLHRLPEVVSLPLPNDDVLVHFPGGDVVLTVERAVDEPFVVSCCAKVVGMVNVGE